MLIKFFDKFKNKIVEIKIYFELVILKFWELLSSFFIDNF
jgi:hypothetical protein